MVDKMLDRDIGFYYKNISSYVYQQLFQGKSKEEVPDHDVCLTLKNLETVTPLNEDKFVAGDDISIADFAIYQSVLFLEMVEYDLTDYPHVEAWKAKIGALPC